MSIPNTPALERLGIAFNGGWDFYGISPVNPFSASTEFQLSAKHPSGCVVQYSTLFPCNSVPSMISKDVTYELNNNLKGGCDVTLKSSQSCSSILSNNLPSTLLCKKL